MANLAECGLRCALQHGIVAIILPTNATRAAYCRDPIIAKKSKQYRAGDRYEYSNPHGPANGRLSFVPNPLSVDIRFPLTNSLYDASPLLKIEHPQESRSNQPSGTSVKSTPLPSSGGIRKRNTQSVDYRRLLAVR